MTGSADRIQQLLAENEKLKAALKNAQDKHDDLYKALRDRDDDGITRPRRQPGQSLKDFGMHYEPKEEADKYCEISGYKLDKKPASELDAISTYEQRLNTLENRMEAMETKWKLKLGLF